MTSTPPSHTHPRSQWLRHWSALPQGQVKATADTLAQRHPVEDLALAQSGLGLLPLADSALGEAYFLGEIPLAQAHVRLRGDNGQTAEGAALLLDDRTGVARAMAILDAVLAARLPGHELAEALLHEGAAVVRDHERQRRALLAATRVDFSLLGSADEEDDDE